MISDEEKALRVLRGLRYCAEHDLWSPDDRQCNGCAYDKFLGSGAFKSDRGQAPGWYIDDVAAAAMKQRKEG